MGGCMNQGCGQQCMYQQGCCGQQIGMMNNMQCGGCCSNWNPFPPTGYSKEEWDHFNMTMEGQNTYRWWANWIPTPCGQQWVHNKRWEAKRVVHGMINQWGLQNLQSGEGVIDIGGDPGFVAAELLRSGIRVTVVDPAFGVSGKQDPMTMQFLTNFDESQLRCIRQPFDQAFVDDPKHAEMMRKASALVSLYPDEATNSCLYFSAAFALRTALIPCNECQQYFPPHNPTYDGFVNSLLELDSGYARTFDVAPCVRERLCNTPYCQVILSRTPVKVLAPISNPRHSLEAPLASADGQQAHGGEQQHGDDPGCSQCGGPAPCACEAGAADGAAGFHGNSSL